MGNTCSQVATSGKNKEPIRPADARKDPAEYTATQEGPGDGAGAQTGAGNSTNSAAPPAELPAVAAGPDEGVYLMLLPDMGGTLLQQYSRKLPEQGDQDRLLMKIKAHPGHSIKASRFEFQEGKRKLRVQFWNAANSKSAAEAKKLSANILEFVCLAVTYGGTIMAYESSAEPKFVWCILFVRRELHKMSKIKSEGGKRYVQAAAEPAASSERSQLIAAESIDAAAVAADLGIDGDDASDPGVAGEGRGVSAESPTGGYHGAKSFKVVPRERTTRATVVNVTGEGGVLGDKTELPPVDESAGGGESVEKKASVDVIRYLREGEELMTASTFFVAFVQVQIGEVEAVFKEGMIVDEVKGLQTAVERMHGAWHKE